MRPAYTRLQRFSLLFSVCVIVFSVSSLLPWKAQPSEESIYQASRKHLQTLNRHLQTYATTHEGGLPLTLWQLAVAADDWPGLRFADPSSRKEYDWLYLAPANLATAPPETMLVASPVSFSYRVQFTDRTGCRMVLFRDGEVRAMPDEAYTLALARQWHEPREKTAASPRFRP